MFFTCECGIIVLFRDNIQEFPIIDCHSCKQKYYFLRQRVCVVNADEIWKYREVKGDGRKK